MLNQEAQVEDVKAVTATTTADTNATTATDPDDDSAKHPIQGNHNPLNDHDYCSPNKRISQPKSSYESNENLSDSSSSSSLSSSVASSRDLVIAQDSYGNSTKSIEPKDTPSVSRSKAHRRKKMFQAVEATNSHQGGQTRIKRVRQNTSVTDKSEWITGEEQIDSVLSEQLVEEPKEKRQRIAKKLDSAFSAYTSSEYSSSDAESDQESDYNSEDDPDRLWCTCQKPHGGKFMICCDVCKDWFHGHCVGVTKLMGDRFEKQGKEWFCGECSEKLRAGIPRNAIPKKIVKKEKKKKAQTEPGKRSRGRPRKSDAIAREGPTRQSLRNARKSSSSLDPKFGVDNGRLVKNKTRPDARSESFDEFENKERLKELIRERKREFFYKRNLAEQQKAAKRNEMGFGRQSLTALSDSLDSLATSTSTQNMNNPPMNIKSEHTDRSKPNIILQINTKKDSSSDQSNPRIVTTIIRSPKRNRHSESNDPVVNDMFTADPIKISKKMKGDTATSSDPKTPPTGESTASNGDAGSRKSSHSGGTSKTDKTSNSQEHSEITPKRKRKDSESSTPNGSSTPIGTKHISQKIKDSLESRSKQIKDLDVTPDQIEKLAGEIEGQLNECFKEGTPKYLNKFRSLLFNLRDPKNQGLVRNVLAGEITPGRLVRMSPEEMASHELAKWRERENEHSIELIKRDAQLAAQQTIVKKTHKGEEVISAPQINDSEEPTGLENQGTPTTPSKNSRESRQDSSKTASSPPSTSGAIKSTGPLKMKITGITSELSMKTSDQVTPEDKSSSALDALMSFDTTKDHKSHVYDMNCKLCTKQISNTSELDDNKSNTGLEAVTAEKEQKSEQPKRLRISIDSKLDPANLSRLKEPLIKPSQSSSSSTNLEADEFNSFQSTSPNQSISNDDEYHDLEENNESYDQETISTLGDTRTSTKSKTNLEPVWSGFISMPDIPKFSALAKPVSGSVEFMKEKVSENLMVCGRIAPDQLQSYIKKVKATTKNQIRMIQLHPQTEDDKANFNNFFDHLYSRNRCGVIQVPQHILKDFYIVPIHEKSSIPEVFKPIKGPGLDRKEPNCLLGLMVCSKKVTTPSTPASSNYTPTPIK